jgi:hypothetical protein
MMPPRSEFATNRDQVSSMISELIAMIRLLININMRYMTEFGQSAVAAVFPGGPPGSGPSGGGPGGGSGSGGSSKRRKPGPGGAGGVAGSIRGK